MKVNNLKRIVFCLLLGWFQAIESKPVNDQTAELIASNFLKTRVVSDLFTGDLKLTLVYTNSSEELKFNSIESQLNYFYVFNANESGFVVVSADDVVFPILAYSDEGIFNPQAIHFSIKKWFQGYADQIRYAIVNQLEATEEIKNEWQDLLVGGKVLTRRASVDPLIATEWNQSPYYNDLCPYDRNEKDNAVTGCVATAMAQVLKYWEYPQTGSGYHSYNHSNFGTISSSFGNHTYDYNNMPIRVKSTNSSVAQLMFDCGVSVDMNYSVSSSGAYVISSMSPVTNCTEYALKTYFGFPSSLSGEKRQGYSDANWIAMLKTDLDAGLPIIYAGFGGGGGHCFIADGYDNNDYFHFNWGWGGSSDGYFRINALNPGSLGSGGGTGGFNSGQQAIIGVKPPSGSVNYDFSLNRTMSTSPSSIGYGGAFSVTANFTNNSNYNFSGDYGAAVFDDNDNFIDFIEIKTDYTLQSGYKYTNDLVFSTTGMLKMLPGKYWIGLYLRPTGGNWSMIKGTFFYSNYKSITVTNTNPIALYSEMVVSNDPWFIQGQPGSVSLNLINKGSTMFKGLYSVDLYNLDGSYAQNISKIPETSGLPSGSRYTNSISFSADSINVPPGTYLLATMYQRDGASSWHLAGTGTYQNPIFVDVIAPPYKDDIYEVNNNASISYLLPLNFSNNKANASTTGSNCHVGSDYDFYKINLPSGFNYTLNPRLHDLFNTGNGNEYSLDALFSYSLDGGTTWSDAFDDILPSTIQTSGGKAIIFKVAPYFSGQVGTYLLDIPVSRVSTLNSREYHNNDIKIYPNPTTSLLYFEGNNAIIKEVEIMDINGRQAATFSEIGENNAISVKELYNGIYLIKITTSNGIFTYKIIKE